MDEAGWSGPGDLGIQRGLAEATYRIAYRIPLLPARGIRHTIGLSTLFAR